MCSSRSACAWSWTDGSLRSPDRGTIPARAAVATGAPVRGSGFGFRGVRPGFRVPGRDGRPRLGGIVPSSRTAAMGKPGTAFGRSSTMRGSCAPVSTDDFRVLDSDSGCFSVLLGAASGFWTAAALPPLFLRRAVTPRRAADRSSQSGGVATAVHRRRRTMDGARQPPGNSRTRPDPLGKSLPSGQGIEGYHQENRFRRSVFEVCPYRRSGFTPSLHNAPTEK